MARVPDQYVWLVWSGAFAIPWIALFAACRRLRTVLWQVGLCTLPFALTEPLFVGRYWSPPSVLVRMLLFPMLRAKTLIGGLLFLAYYAAFLALLAWIAQDYMGRVWLRDIPGGRIMGAPWAEPAFALTMGMFWSGGYEQAVWLFAPPGHHLYGSQYFGPLRERHEIGRA